MLKLSRNPLYIYVFAFLITFLVYGLGWSNLYPPLSPSMKIFLFITFFVFIFCGWAINKLKLIRKSLSRTSPNLIRMLFYILMGLYAVEFIYENNIPLLSKLRGEQGVNYMEFGIPLLHGILISFNSFLIAHSFATYMSTKDKMILKYSLLLYLPALLFISRSIMVMGVLTSLFIYLHFVGKIKFLTMVKLVVAVFFGLYLFGVIGNLRSGGNYFYVQSEAKDEFMESSIPKEYYWTYLYVGSPLANFQNTVNQAYIREYDFAGFVFYENLPKIISKNLGGVLNIEERDLIRLTPWLTVGTTYAKSFAYLGWMGPYLMFIINLIVYLIVLFLVPRNSSYHITTISILSIIILLNIFSNILVVTGISFQLVYCIIFSFFERKRIVIRS